MCATIKLKRLLGICIEVLIVYLCTPILGDVLRGCFWKCLIGRIEHTLIYRLLGFRSGSLATLGQRMQGLQE